MRPSTRTPAPTPVPSVSMIAFSAPRASPKRHSASSAALPSLSTATGSPRRSTSTSRTATPCSGRWLESSAAPGAGSTRQGIPSPTANTGAGAASPASWTASTSWSISAPASSVRARRYARWCTSSFESTVPASSFVPPRSTPMTQPAAMIGHHTWLMAGPPAPPEYKPYRTRPRLPRRGADDGSMLDELRGAPPKERKRKPISVGRVVKWLALALVAWIGLSLVLFLISAQVNQDQVSAAAQAQLSDGGVGILKPQTTLILGSDQRTKGTKDPGPSPWGPSRSDSILLVRTGGGHSAKLSIPRDTVVDIPGHGRNKINAAYAIGGAALTVQTIKQYLGISIDHVFEVNFDNFPALVDAMGGINYTGGCVVSKINGGFKNGGFTLRLRRGTTHINGKQALALARPRHNACNPKENDLTRARRQQKVISAMKSRVFSPAGFIRLPFISWNAPKTLKTDMRGPALLGYAIGTAISGSAQTEVLRPSGGVTLPDGGAGLTVSDAEKQADVRRFLDG